MKLTWDNVGDRLYRIGLDRGVLYLPVGGDYITGVAWNGLTDVSIDSGERSTTPLYTFDRRVRILVSPEECSGSISAYTYPDEFDICQGYAEMMPGMHATGQDMQPFGLSFRTLIGNDVDGTDHGYEIHLLYDAVVTSVKDENKTVSDSLEPKELSWDFEACPETFSDTSLTNHIVINSTKFDASRLSSLEEILYGTDETDPRLPHSYELFDLFPELET